MADNLRVAVDYAAGRFEIEGPSETVRELINDLSNLFKNSNLIQANDIPDSDAPNGALDTDISSEKNTPEKNRDKKQRKRSSNGKARDYQIVELGLDESQREKLRSFVKEKSPKSQNDQVAVIGVFLKEALERETFSCNDIFTAYRITELKVPKNLPAVFGNMEQAGLAVREHNELKINYLAEDHVKHHLPKTEKASDS